MDCLGDITHNGRGFMLGGQPIAGELAHAFRSAFGQPQRGDVGKRVWRDRAGLHMESPGQRDARLAAMVQGKPAPRAAAQRLSGLRLTR